MSLAFMHFWFTWRNNQESLYIKQIHNLKEPYGKCSDTHTLKYFDTYSLASCYLDCKQRYLLEKCGCREYYMPAGMDKNGKYQSPGRLQKILVWHQFTNKGTVRGSKKSKLVQLEAFQRMKIGSHRRIHDFFSFKEKYGNTSIEQY